LRCWFAAVRKEHKQRLRISAQENDAAKEMELLVEACARRSMATRVSG
jgi:hypothetical protein